MRPAFCPQEETDTQKTCDESKCQGRKGCVLEDPGREEMKYQRKTVFCFLREQSDNVGKSYSGQIWLNKRKSFLIIRAIHHWMVYLGKERKIHLLYTNQKYSGHIYWAPVPGGKLDQVISNLPLATQTRETPLS